MLQRTIRLTDAHVSRYTTAQSSLVSESHRLFLRRLLEQEELPRRVTEREEQSARLALVAGRWDGIESIVRREMQRTFEMEWIGLRWQRKSKEKVLFRTNALYANEAALRASHEEDQYRRRTLDIHEPMLWRCIEVQAPRAFVMASATAAKSALSRDEAVCRTNLFEQFDFESILVSEHVAARRLEKMERIHAMVTLGASGRRQIETEEQLDALQRIREPHERWLHERRFWMAQLSRVAWWHQTFHVEREEFIHRVEVEEAFHRVLLMQWQVETAAVSLMSQLEATARAAAVDRRQCGMERIQRECRQGTIRAREQSRRRGILSEEAFIAVIMEESFQRRMQDARAVLAGHMELSHMPRRLRVLQSENDARNRLAQTHRELVEEPLGRSQTEQGERIAFVLLEAGRDENVAFFGFFAEERRQRRSLAQIEFDEWETIGLTQLFRRSSMRFLPLPQEITSSPNRTQMKERETPPSCARSESSNRMVLSSRDFATPIDAAALEDSEVLRRLQVLRREDQEWRELMTRRNNPLVPNKFFTPTKPMGDTYPPSPARPPSSRYVHGTGNLVVSPQHVASPKPTFEDGYTPTRPPLPTNNIRQSSRTGLHQPSPRSLNVASMVPW
jgi:hypothetical protein